MTSLLNEQTGLSVSWRLGLDRYWYRVSGIGRYLPVLLGIGIGRYLFEYRHRYQ